MLIGIATYNGWIRAELGAWLAECTGARVVPVTGKPVEVARNYLVSLAQWDRFPLIMVDADAAPAPGTFAVLRDKVNQEVCVAGVPYLTPTGAIGVGELPPNLREVEHLSGWHPSDMLSCHVVAYNIEVFDNVPMPYFVQEYNHHHTRLKNEAEDTILHRRLRDRGVPLYCNWSYWAGHVVEKTLDKPRSLTETEKFLVMAGL